mmetsp:Transcript_81476/g.136377  ORF Transcript_81476/g.136377 Transcript_81476/m.136377 type:complete len:295 (+) Transcript_81476:581-1465(+)
MPLLASVHHSPVLWLWWWGLRLIDEWHLLLLSQATAGDGPRPERRHWEPRRVCDTAGAPTDCLRRCLRRICHRRQVDHELRLVLCHPACCRCCPSVGIHELHAQPWVWFHAQECCCIPSPGGDGLHWGWGGCWPIHCQQPLGVDEPSTDHCARLPAGCHRLHRDARFDVVHVDEGDQREAPHAVSDFQRQAHVGHDMAVHHDVRLIHRLRLCLPQVDPRRLRVPAQRRPQSPRPLCCNVRVDGSVCGIPCPPCGWVALGQVVRVRSDALGHHHRNPQHSGCWGAGAGSRQLRDP